MMSVKSYMINCIKCTINSNLISAWSHTTLAVGYRATYETCDKFILNGPKFLLNEFLFNSLTLDEATTHPVLVIVNNLCQADFDNETRINEVLTAVTALCSPIDTIDRLNLLHVALSGNRAAWREIYKTIGAMVNIVITKSVIMDNCFFGFEFKAGRNCTEGELYAFRDEAECYYWVEGNTLNYDRNTDKRISITNRRDLRSFFKGLSLSEYDNYIAYIVSQIDEPKPFGYQYSISEIDNLPID